MNTCCMFRGIQVRSWNKASTISSHIITFLHSPISKFLVPLFSSSFCNFITISSFNLFLCCIFTLPVSHIGSLYNFFCLILPPFLPSCSKADCALLYFFQVVSRFFQIVRRFFQVVRRLRPRSSRCHTHKHEQLPAPVQRPERGKPFLQVLKLMCTTYHCLLMERWK